MVAYRIEITGFASNEPKVDLSFKGENEKGNADLKQILDIANELKSALWKLQKINLGLEETNQAE